MKRGPSDIRARSLSRAAAGALLALVAAPSPAAAEDPPFVPWTDLLPGLTAGYDPSSENLCKKGHPQCVDSVIREMTRRFDDLAAVCDHDAVFALTYLRTTEEYQRASETPGFFLDPAFVNHEDAVFAQYYFDAWDAWHEGDVWGTPAAWRVAFKAADQRKVKGLGNVFLGMNAHIQRDLPFVLESIGLVAPDGTSRKEDHDQVNVFLNKVADDLFPELARRFDPTIESTDVPGTDAEDFLSFQVVAVWRELAWRHAELLVTAPDPLTRSLIAAEIEAYAESQAVALRIALGYGLLSSSASRDAWCAAHHDDP